MEEKSNKIKKIRHTIIGDLTVIVVVMVLTLILNNTVLMSAYVPSESMENTLKVNDYVMGNRLAYKFGADPKRFDIVIFHAPDGEKGYYVKRIIGLPGEKVKIKNNQVYINDSAEPLDDSFIKEPMLEEDMVFQVPAGCYFMLGDNRNCSYDSREWANPYIAREDIVAKVILKFWKGFCFM